MCVCVLHFYVKDYRNCKNTLVITVMTILICTYVFSTEKTEKGLSHLRSLKETPPARVAHSTAFIRLVHCTHASMLS